MIRRTPLKRSTTPIRKRRAGKPRRRVDPAYLAWLHTWPCIVCALLHHILVERMRYETTEVWQKSPTEAAHVGCRGLSRKCSDREAVPLCGWAHHRNGPESAHVLGRNFWDYHGLDRDAIIAELNRRYEEDHGSAND